MDKSLATATFSSTWLPTSVSRGDKRSGCKGLVMMMMVMVMPGDVINEILYVSVKCVCVWGGMIYSLDEGCSIFLVKMHQLTVRVMDSAEPEEK